MKYLEITVNHWSTGGYLIHTEGITMAVHVGIIDKDPIRLLTPLFDERSSCEHVVFIGDDSQTEIYQRLTSLLTKQNITTEFFSMPSVVNTSLIKRSIKALAKNLKQKNMDVKLNASCGIRYRLLSVYEIFHNYKWPVFVVEPNANRLCWIYPNGRESVQLQDRITIQDYLTVFGARCELNPQELSTQVNQKLTKLGELWAGNAIELAPGLATLNYLATTCRKEKKLDVKLSVTQQSYRELKMLISDLEDASLATYQCGVLTFVNEDARRFSNGEWLEILVSSTIKQIQENSHTIQDCSLNVQVYRKIGNHEIKNKLDVATVVNNRLHIIECKTRDMRTDGDDTLYKLESLRDLLGGFQARAMLVSFQPLRHSDVTRADELGIALIGPDKLTDLKKYLHQWISEAVGQDIQ